MNNEVLFFGNLKSGQENFCISGKGEGKEDFLMIYGNLSTFVTLLENSEENSKIPGYEKLLEEKSKKSFESKLVFLNFRFYGQL